MDVQTRFSKGGWVDFPRAPVLRAPGSSDGGGVGKVGWGPMLEYIGAMNH